MPIFGFQIMNAQLVHLKKKMELVMTHLAKTRNARQSGAPPTKTWYNMFAHLAPLEKRQPLMMTHLEQTRRVTQPNAPVTNEW
jgi:hypothetical protein